MPRLGGPSGRQIQYHFIAMSLEICYNPHGDKEQYHIEMRYNNSYY